MRIAALLALALLARLAGAADYTIVRRTTIDRKTTQQTEYWSPKRLVVDDAAQRTIIDFRTGRVLLADKEERSYTEIPMSALRRQLDAVGAILDRLPASAREAVGLGGSVTLAPNGNRTTIAGHAADEYGVGGDGVTGWVWLAPDLDPATILGDEAAAWWRTGGPLAIGPLAGIARAITEGGVKGMPMRASINAGSKRGAVDVESKVLSVRAEPPPPDVAKVPAGYRKATSPLGG